MIDKIQSMIKEYYNLVGHRPTKLYLTPGDWKQLEQELEYWQLRIDEPRNVMGMEVLIVESMRVE